MIKRSLSNIINFIDSLVISQFRAPIDVIKGADVLVPNEYQDSTDARVSGYFCIKDRWNLDINGSQLVKKGKYFYEVNTVTEDNGKKFIFGEKTLVRSKEGKSLKAAYKGKSLSLR